MNRISSLASCLVALLACESRTAAQTTPHSGGNTPFRAWDLADDRGVLATALFYEGCHLHLEVRRPRTHRGEMIVPFAVLNDAETAIGGYRVIALVVAPDGTIRNRQPLDITREIQSGDRHSANLTLRDIPMHNDYIVLVLEKVVRREAPCEFGRDETERAAREALARKRQ